MKAGALFVAAFIASACMPSYFDPQEERAGILFDWGTQEDREGLELLLEACEGSLGFGFKHGAAIKFVGDANPHCRIPSTRPVAGCWIQDFDLIVLEEAPRLVETALCHELLHRQLFELRSDPDQDHRSSEWGVLAAALAQLRNGTEPPRRER